MHRRKLSLVCLLALAGIAALLASTPPPAAQQPSRDNTASLNGLWDATVIINNLEIPFRYEIAVNGKQAQGFFFEGERRVGSSSGSFINGQLTLNYEHLNTVMELHLQGQQLVGDYRQVRPGSPSLAIRARRFVPAQGMSNPPQVAGQWFMSRVPAERSAPRDTRTWTLFLRQSGAEVSGSVLRVDGDTGTLEGHWVRSGSGGKLVLSHFAGERPAYLEAVLNADGTLSITLDGGAHYIAARSSEARARGIPDPPDPSRYTSVKDPTDPFHFRGLGMNGKTVSDADPQFKGKVVILAIGGSWCPNCHDEAPFLTELYNKYHPQGLEIVGLSFEEDADPQQAWPRMQAFIRRYKIPYPMVLMGDTTMLAAKLPQLVNFGAYPTSVYLGRDGRVRSVHAGFASEATGEEHLRLKRQITELVEKLLAEK